MPIATARVSNELTVQQLVEALVSEWTDDENDVLAHLARLLEADTRDRGHEGIAVYYRHPLDEENENGSVKYHPLKIPVDKDVLVNLLFGITENDNWKMEDKRLYVYADGYRLNSLQYLQRPFLRIDALPKPINTTVSLSDIFVNQFDITRFLLGNNLPVPQDWHEIVASGDGLTRSTRSKGGKQRKYNQGLQEAINRIRENVGPNLTLGTLKDWFRNNLNSDEPYSFDPPIPNCYDLYIDGSKLVWKDREDREQDMSLKSLERYVRRANHPEEA